MIYIFKKRVIQLNKLFLLTATLNLLLNIINVLNWGNLLLFPEEFEEYIEVFLILSLIFLLYFILEEQNKKEMKKWELMKLQNEKMSTIQYVSGGLAHDLNNILTIMLGNISLMKDDKKLQGETKENLKELEAATLQAHGIIEQLFTFTKKGEYLEKKPVNISSLIKEAAEFILHGSNVKLYFNNEEIIYAKVNSVQITRVIHNIVLNSLQAIKNNGTITLSVKRFLKKNNLKNLSYIKPNQDYIQCVIEDNGEGITNENQTKIFDPFFTTKTKGTGLGLSVVYNIITNHEGFILLESELGIGTKITIILPEFTKSSVLEKKK